MSRIAWDRARDKPALSAGVDRQGVQYGGRMIEVWPAERRYRGGDPAEGIDTRHAFSFGAHYDPGNLRFGLLLACNEERLAPGAGFAEHPHRDVEIVTWVVEGTLEHRDSAGHAALVRPGQVQRLSAGAGVRHTERNAGPGPLRFVQIWLHPERFGGPPRHDVTGAPEAEPLSPLGQPGARLRVGRGALALPAAPFTYVHVVRGRVALDGAELGAGDAARLTGGPGAAVEPCGPGPVEFLVWEMHDEPSYG